MAIQVISRLRDAFAIEIPLRALFEAPTVAALAEWIEAARRGGRGRAAPPIRPAPRAEALPLSFAQEALWYLDQLAPGQPTYNVAAAVRVTGPLDVEALERACNAILRRHGALRTTFAAADGRPVALIARDLTLKAAPAGPAGPARGPA